MNAHRYGGSWTDEKLSCLQRYLEEYRKIFSKNQRAQYFKTIYFDAFAGAPDRIHSNDSTPPTSNNLEFCFDDSEDDKAIQLIKNGSPKLALEIDPPFHKYIFVDKSRKHIKELNALKHTYISLQESIEIHRGDANQKIADWCSSTDWKKNRAVAFLDPYGMQVDWKSLELIAATKAIDMWLLFPLGQAVTRLLTSNKEPPEQWADLLTNMFGTDQWKTDFYSSTNPQTAFSFMETNTHRRIANLDQIKAFFSNRLKEIFYDVAPPLELRNSVGTPLFLLFFAASNKNGAPIAVRIASHILSTPPKIR